MPQSNVEGVASRVRVGSLGDACTTRPDTTGSVPKAFQTEPYATLSLGGSILLHRVPEWVGLSLEEIRALREIDLFPKPKGPSCAPWWPAKQLAAYRWGLHCNAKLADAVALTLGRRDPDWAKSTL